MQALTPAKFSSIVYAGSSYEALVHVYRDAAETESFDLSGWAVKMDIHGVKELTEEDGLTVTAEEGEILIQLSAEETSAPAQRSNTPATYVLSIEREGKTFYLMHGTLLFEQP
jgi:hypothetical protein